MKTSFHLKHRRADAPRRVRSLADRWAARKKLITIARICSFVAATVSFVDNAARAHSRFPVGGYVLGPFGAAINGKGEVVLSQAQQNLIAETELNTGERHNPFIVSGTQLAQALKNHKHVRDGLLRPIVDMVPEDRAFLVGEDMYDTSEELKGPKGPLGHL